MNHISPPVFESSREVVRTLCPCDVCRQGDRLIGESAAACARPVRTVPAQALPPGPIRLVPRIRLAS
jgi:hypothetical protein